MKIKNWAKIAALSSALSFGHAAEAQTVKQDKDSVKTEMVSQSDIDKFIETLEQIAETKSGAEQAKFVDLAKKMRTDTVFAQKEVREFNQHQRSQADEFNQARKDNADEFNQYRKDNAEELSQFRETQTSGNDSIDAKQRNKEYAKALAQPWQEFELHEGIEAPNYDPPGKDVYYHGDTSEVAPEKTAPQYEQVKINDEEKYNTNRNTIEDALNFKHELDTRDGTNKIKVTSTARALNFNKASVAATYLDKATTPEQTKNIMTKALDGVELVDGKPVYKGKIWDNYNPNTNVGRSLTKRLIRDYKPGQKKDMSPSQFMQRIKSGGKAQ